MQRKESQVVQTENTIRYSELAQFTQSIFSMYESFVQLLGGSIGNDYCMPPNSIFQVSRADEANYPQLYYLATAT
jgi:hypothetical protein